MILIFLLKMGKGKFIKTKSNFKKSVVKVIESTAEQKTHGISFGPTNITATQQLVGLTEVPIGTLTNERIGNKWRPQGLSFRYCIRRDANTSVGACIRIMIVRSRLVDALVITDFPLLNKTSNYNRIFVLYDKIHVVTGATGAGPQVITRKGFIKKKRLLEMVSSFASTTNIKNALVLMFVTDAGSLYPTIEGSFNLTFIDT